MRKPKKTPPRLNEAHTHNFDLIRKAEAAGDLALVSAIRKADQKPVALVCAMQRNADHTITPVPLAVMVEGNPFKLFEDPTK